MLVLLLVYLPHGDIFIENDWGINAKAHNRFSKCAVVGRVGDGGLGARSGRFPLRHPE